MAIHHPTPPFGGGERPRLPSAQGSRFSRGRESVHKVDTFGSGGPVTRAIRACRETDPADLAIAEIQIGLASFFADADHQRVRDLRRRIADRIEADLALLDALAGDTDHEPDVDREPDTDGEPSLCGLMVQWPGGGGDDRENDTADDEAGNQPLHMGGGGYAVTSFGRSA